MARSTRTRTNRADSPRAGGAAPEGQHEGEEPRGAAAEGPVLIDLALQGGGSHGAFTWGVLDRLLQDDRFRIDGVSGTSAGAMNAAVMAAGFAKGGADVTLTEDGADTILKYAAKADVGGKIAQLGSRLIESTSKKLAGQFFSTFGDKVGNG